MVCSPPGSSVLDVLPGKNTGVGCHAFLQGVISDPGIEPASPALAGGFFITELPGKPSDTHPPHLSTVSLLGPQHPAQFGNSLDSQHTSAG